MWSHQQRLRWRGHWERLHDQHPWAGHSQGRDSQHWVLVGCIYRTGQQSRHTIRHVGLASKLWNTTRRSMLQSYDNKADRVDVGWWRMEGGGRPAYRGASEGKRNSHVLTLSMRKLTLFLIRDSMMVIFILGSRDTSHNGVTGDSMLFYIPQSGRSKQSFTSSSLP